MIADVYFLKLIGNMKYKLLKDLPLAKIGEEVILEKWQFIWKIYFPTAVEDIYLCDIHMKDISEWLEPIVEKKSIYDLKEGDEYWYISVWNNVLRWPFMQFDWIRKGYAHYSNFPTEREAKRNKLLRELATRTDKWLPNKWEKYISWWRVWNFTDLHWVDDNEDYIRYHTWFVFRDKEEYNKWMTEDNKNLLFTL